MKLIQLINVTKVIKNRQILHDVNFNIKQGSIATLEGINGSGKTLILKALLGLIKVRGEIKVDQESVLIQDSYPIKAGIMIENPSLVEDFNARQNLDLLAKLDPNISTKQIEQLLEYFDLDEFPKQKVRKFSLGMKQKLGISQAFLGNYPLIVLDEPTNALDHESINKLIDLIKDYNRRGSTFVIASHDHQFVEQISNQKLYVKEGTVKDES